MVKLAGLALACLMFAGCTASESEASSATSATTESSTSTAPTPTPTSTSANLDQAIAICTDGIAGPDALVSDAAHGAREGTRSTSEVAAAFRQAQDAVEGLSLGAGSAGFPQLSQSLQNYADVLGRARVVGDVGLTEITVARQEINTRCLLAGTEQ